LKAILCTTSTKQLHNAYYKNYSQLTICVQAANLSDCRIESNRNFLARIGMLYWRDSIDELTVIKSVGVEV